MSTILEDQIADEVEGVNDVMQVEFEGDSISETDSIEAEQLAKLAQPLNPGRSFRDDLPWWHPTSRLDWFSKYTIRSVVLMLSFLVFGLVVSNILLSW